MLYDGYNKIDLNETYKNSEVIVNDTCKNNKMIMNKTRENQVDVNEQFNTLIYRLGKYVSCSRCRYKVLNYNPRLVQSETEIHKLQFFDILCSHCKKYFQHECLGQDFISNENLLKLAKWKHPFHKRRAVSASKIESEAIDKTSSELYKGKPKFPSQIFLNEEKTNKTTQGTHYIAVSSSDIFLTTNKKLQLLLKESKNKDLSEIYTSKDSIVTLDVKDFREEIKNIQKIMKTKEEIDEEYNSKQRKIASNEILNDTNESALKQKRSNINELSQNLESEEQIGKVTLINGSLPTFVSPVGESIEDFKYFFVKPKTNAPDDKKLLRKDKTSSEILKEIKRTLSKKKEEKGIRRKEDGPKKDIEENKLINSDTEIKPDEILWREKNNIPKEGKAVESKSDTLIQSKEDRNRNKYDKGLANVIKKSSKSVKQKSGIDKVSKSTPKNYDSQKLAQDAIQSGEIVSKKRTYKELKEMKVPNHETQEETKIAKKDEDVVELLLNKQTNDKGPKQINDSSNFEDSKQMHDIKLTQKLEKAPRQENKKANEEEKEQNKIQTGKIESKKYKQGLAKDQRNTKEIVGEYDKKNIKEDRVVKEKTKKENHESKLKTKSQPREILPDKKLIKTGEQEERIKKEEKMEERQNINELDPKQIKLLNTSLNNIVHLITKFKQEKNVSSRGKAEKIDTKPITKLNVYPEKTNSHANQTLNQSGTSVSIDSELELDLNNINRQKGVQLTEMIVGEKIVKYKQLSPLKKQKEDILPIFHNANDDNSYPLPQENDLEYQNKISYRLPVDVTGKRLDQETTKGVIKYALSDRTFIDKGWTMLPTEKVVRKMNVYRMRPAHLEFDWFHHNKNKKIMHYDTGEHLAEINDNGRGRWFYRNGRLALDYYDSEELNSQQRIVIYSNGEPDERGRARPLTILATFDHIGNGVVFDHAGKIRLKYNQTEGVLLDRSIGPVSRWKWHTLNDPPVLQQVMVDTQMAHKDPDIIKLGGPVDDITKVDNEEMLAIEFENFIKEKSKKSSQKFKPFQIRMKALKINENFSLKILDQATVYLIYRDGSISLKLNIGMVLDHKEIVDTDLAEVGEVSNSIERFPAKTDSLAGLQKSVEFAQRVERARMERERRFRPAEPSASSDKLVAATSKPPRPRLYTIPSGCTLPNSECRCRNRKSCMNLYYDTRLM